MTIKASQVKTAFFPQNKPRVYFPPSYMGIWQGTSHSSNIYKIKALLKDYTKESFFLGSFLGRFFSGHWNRHHIDKVQHIIKRPYECTDDIIYDLKLLKPEKEGSLAKRIHFIDIQITGIAEQWHFMTL